MVKLLKNNYISVSSWNFRFSNTKGLSIKNFIWEKRRLPIFFDNMKNSLSTWTKMVNKNKNKTTLFFSKSTSENVRLAIKGSLGLQELAQYEKYLRLPSLIGREKKGFLITSKKEYRENYKVVKGSYYHKLVVNFS